MLRRPAISAASLFLLAALPSALGTPPREGGPPALTRIEITLHVDPGRRSLEGQADYWFEGATGGELTIRLGADYELLAASWGGAEGRVGASFEQRVADTSAGSVERWLIRAPSELAEAALRLKWRAKAGAKPIGLSPAGIRLLDDDGWYPRPASGGGKFTLELEAEHSSRYRLVLAGAPEAEGGPAASRTISRFRPEYRLRGASLIGVAGKTVRRDVGRVPLSISGEESAMPPRSNELLATIDRELEDLVVNVGPFPWPRFELILQPGAGQVEAPGVLLVSPDWITRLAGGRRAGLAREVLLRQWLGQSLFATDREGEDLLAGVALFLSHVAETEKERAAWRHRLLERWSEDWSSPHPAERLAMTLEMLSARFGRPKVHDALRALVGRRAHQRCGWADLAAVLVENVGRDAANLARLWKEQDPPELSISDVRRRSRGGEEWIDVVLAADRPARLFVPVIIEGPAGLRVRREGRLDGDRLALTSVTEFPARRVVIDPDHLLARRLSAPERTPRLGRIAEGPDLILLGSGRGTAFERQARQLARSRYPAARVLLDREARAEVLRQARRVLLLFRPGPGFWSQLGGDAPESWRVDGPGVGVAGRRTTSPAGFAATAAPHDASGEGVLILVDATAPESAAAALDAIEHEASAAWLFSADGETIESGAPLGGELSWDLEEPGQSPVGERR